MKTYLSLVALLLLPLLTLAQDPIKIAFVGNSITEGPGRENPESFRDFLVERIFRLGWLLLERQWQVRTDYCSFAQKQRFFLPNLF